VHKSTVIVSFSTLMYFGFYKNLVLRTKNFTSKVFYSQNKVFVKVFGSQRMCYGGCGLDFQF